MKSKEGVRCPQNCPGPECFPDLGCQFSASGLSQSQILEKQFLVSSSPLNIYLKMVPRFTLKGSGYRICAKALLQKNSLEPIQRRFLFLIHTEQKLYQIGKKKKKISLLTFPLHWLFFFSSSILWLLHANNLLVWMA